MSKIAWDQVGEKVYETGVDRGVLFVTETDGTYGDGVGWNGLTTVTESPSGAESNKQYADNQVYLNLLSAEEFGGTIEAFTYPDEFGICDGTAEPVVGIFVAQQSRRSFGFSWRSLIGNDVLGTDFGYKVHLAYGALAAPSEKANATINDSPEATALSWEFSTTPVEVPGLKRSAHLVIDSTKVDSAKLSDLEDILYGTEGQEPRLPLPEEVFALFEGAGATLVTPTKPTNVGNVITIPAITGTQYKIDGDPVSSGAQPAITEDVIVSVVPLAGYKFPPVTDVDWLFTHS